MILSILILKNFILQKQLLQGPWSPRKKKPKYREKANIKQGGCIFNTNLSTGYKGHACITST